VRRCRVISFSNISFETVCKAVPDIRGRSPKAATRENA
jgi:hypothetical protein